MLGLWRRVKGFGMPADAVVFDGDDVEEWDRTDAYDAMSGPTRQLGRRPAVRLRWRPLLKRVSGRIAVIWVVMAVMSVQAEMVGKGGLLDDPAALLFQRAGGIVEEVRYAAWVELSGPLRSRPPTQPPPRLEQLRERVAAWMGAGASIQTGPGADAGPETGIAPHEDGWVLRISGVSHPVLSQESIGVSLQRLRGELLAALAAGRRAMQAFPDVETRLLSRLSPQYWGVTLSGIIPQRAAGFLTSVKRVKGWAIPLFDAVGGRLVGVVWTPEGVRVLGTTHRLPRGGGGAGDGDAPMANLEIRLEHGEDGAINLTVLTRPEIP